MMVIGGKMAIQIDRLTHVYMKGTPFEKKALDDISLNIEDGEFVGIIGHTGSGKSTLVLHLKGILKPTSGSVYVGGKEASVKNKVGILFQNPEHQLFKDTVYEDVAYGLKIKGIDGERADKKVKEVADFLGIGDEFLKKSPFELSWGEKKLAAMAGVLVSEPEILVLDEPSAGLDAKARDSIFKAVQKLSKGRNITVIMVSHCMKDVVKFVDRVIVMDRGKIKIDRPVKEVFNCIDKLKSIGVDVPDIVYFMKELKHIIPDLNDNVLTVAEAKEEIKKYLKRNKRFWGEKV